MSPRRHPRSRRTAASLLSNALVATGLAAPTLVVTAPSAEAQVRGSERSVVSQTADGTTVRVDYARPHLRARGPAFPDIVGWGHVWTPGANEATTVQVTSDVTLDGVDLPEGTYSLWMVPRPDTWEVIFDPNAGLYHTQPPEAHDGQIRLTVTPERTDETEALTFDFPLVRPHGMDLRFRWGTVEISLEVEVPPSRVATLTPDQAAPYLTTFQVSPGGPPPPGVPADAPMPSMTLRIDFEDGRLLARVVDGMPMFGPEFQLIPVAEGVFNPAWMRGGEVFETEVDMYFEFVFADGEPTGFDVLGLNDRLMMRGERVP